METHSEVQAGSQPIPIINVVPRAVTLTIPQAQKYEQEGREAVAFAAGGVTIVTHQDYLIIGEKLKAVIRAKATIMREFKESKDAAFQAHRKVCALERRLLEPLEKVEKDCNEKAKVYLQAKQERERREAEEIRRKADEEARQKAEREKAAQDDERLKVAQQLSDSGFKEEAEQVLAQDIPAVPAVPVIVKQVERLETVPGQHLRTTYKFIVDNLMMLVQEVAAGRQPITLLLANQSALDKMAMALKGELRIPGGHVEKNSTVVNVDRNKNRDIE